MRLTKQTEISRRIQITDPAFIHNHKDKGLCITASGLFCEHHMGSWYFML
jgi:hypothetical protein